ncbi:MAG: cyclic nucleotide-binding domain-containing protein, partial [Rhodospirillaceae bacterium]
MIIEGLRPTLEAHPFLRNAPESMLELMTGCARNETFSPGDFLIREGRVAERFLLIRQGTVSLSAPSGPEGPVLETLSDGDALGWSWLIEPYMWTFNAKAVSSVRA